MEFVETRTTCPLPPILGVQILKRRSISACSSARRGTVDEVVVVFPPGVPGTGITAAEGADDGSGKAGVLGAAELEDAPPVSAGAAGAASAFSSSLELELSLLSATAVALPSEGKARKSGYRRLTK